VLEGEVNKRADGSVGCGPDGPPYSRIGMTRRIFIGGVAGLCAAGDHLVLEAIAAERMPHRIVVHGVAWAPVFEVRDYGAARDRAVEVLRRCGPLPYGQGPGDGKLLFSFESLASRESAWRRASTDPAWIEIGARLREIAVYRASS
jgi:hypothetical protein